MILFPSVCSKGCITEHKQAVPHSVGVEHTLRPGSTGQDIRPFMSNIVDNKGDLKIIHLLKYF